VGVDDLWMTVQLLGDGLIVWMRPRRLVDA